MTKKNFLPWVAAQFLILTICLVSKSYAVDWTNLTLSSGDAHGTRKGRKVALRLSNSDVFLAGLTEEVQNKINALSSRNLRKVTCQVKEAFYTSSGDDDSSEYRLAVYDINCPGQSTNSGSSASSSSSQPPRQQPSKHEDLPAYSPPAGKN